MHGSSIPAGTTTDRPAPAIGGTAPARPRLRHDVVFADSGKDGVFVRHSDAGFMLTGRTAYSWMTALAPYLNGQHTIDELCAGLTDDRRAMVTMIVNTLVERGFARDAEPGVECLSPEVAEAFRRQLGFVAHFSDNEQERFRRFRNARILVAGPVPVVTAAAANLLRNGAGRVDVAGASAAEVAAAVAAKVDDLGAVAGTVVPWPRAVPTAAELDGFDAVAVVVTPTTSRLVCDLLTSGRADGPTLFPVTPVADTIVFGPATRPATAPCWACAMLRLPASVDPGAIADVWRSAALPGAADDSPIGARTGAMVGSEVAFELFRFFTGCLVAETDGSVLVQDRLTMETRREQLLPHPRCPACTVHTPRLASAPAPMRSDLIQPDKDGDPHPFQRSFDLLSPHVGILLEYTDERFEQAPVKAARVRVGQGAPDGGPAELTAFHVRSMQDARTAVLDRALAAYVDAVGTPAPVPGSDVTVPVERLLTASGIPAPDGPVVAATSLVTGAVVGVPAAAVYPFHAVNASGAVERTPAGHAGGETEDEARAAGLLSALAYRALLATCSGAPATRLTFTDLDQDAHAELWFLLRSVEQFDQRADVLLLNTGEPAPVVLAVVGGASGESGGTGDTWSVAAGHSVESAVVDALTEAVGLAQLARATQEPVSTGSPLLADFDPRTVEAVGTADFNSLDGPSATTTGIVDALRASGNDVLAADTTTRDLRVAGRFATVRVLIVGAGPGPHRPG